MSLSTVERIRVSMEAGDMAKRQGRPAAELDLTTWPGLVADRLRTLRMKKFDTQEAFAEALTQNGLEMSRRGVGNWESATRAPHIWELPTIAFTLGISVRSILPANPPDLDTGN